MQNPEDCEVLLEVEGSKRPLRVSRDSILCVVRSELCKLGLKGSLLEIGASIPSENRTENDYVLQRWCSKFQTYVDVTDYSQLQDRDRITVTRISPTSSNAEAITQKAVEVSSKLGKPTPVHAKVLRTLFPSSTRFKKRESLAFDPLEDCVFSQEQKKKKGARIKPVNISVFVVSKQTTSIPRGAWRRKLIEQKHLIRTELLRSMSPKQVRATIADCLTHLDVNNNFTLLDCTGHRLAVATDQEPTGEMVIEQVLKRKGSVLYISPQIEDLNEDLPVIDLTADESTKTTTSSAVVPTSDDSHYTINDHDIPGRFCTVTQGIGTIPDDSNSSTSSCSRGNTTDHESSRPGVDPELLQWRRIRLEQDIAMAESLRIDQEKDVVKANQLRQEQERTTLIATLCKKFEDRRGNINVRFLLPDSSRVTHSFLAEDTPRVLYQYVLTFNVSCPYVLKTCSVEQRLIDHTSNILIQDLSIGNSTLIVQLGDKGPSFDFLAENSFQTDFPLLSSRHREMFKKVEDVLDSLKKPIEFPDENYDDSDFLDSGAAEVKTTAEMESDIADVFLCGDKKLECIEGGKDRMEYLNSVQFKKGDAHVIRRNNLYEDVLNVYRDQSIVHEYPIEIKYHDEQAIDDGGVTRDMFAGFWEEAFQKLFEGSSTLVPLVHPPLDITVFSLLGRILSHGYLVCGYLPIQIALPTLLTMLFGPSVEISREICLEAFLEFINDSERAVFKKAMTPTDLNYFSPEMQVSLVEVLSRFGCRKLPTPKNLLATIESISRYEFTIKPAAAIALVFSGVPEKHRGFWLHKSVNYVTALYNQLSVSSDKVLSLLVSPEVKNANEANSYAYLKTMIANMKRSELRNFLRFVTGSSVCTSSKIYIEFNTLTGIGRRPIAHTCSCVLEVSSSYRNFQDFCGDFDNILSKIHQEYTFRMDAV